MLAKAFLKGLLLLLQNQILFLKRSSYIHQLFFMQSCLLFEFTGKGTVGSTQGVVVRYRVTVIVAVSKAPKKAQKEGDKKSQPSIHKSFLANATFLLILCHHIKAQKRESFPFIFYDESLRPKSFTSCNSVDNEIREIPRKFNFLEG